MTLNDSIIQQHDYYYGIHSVTLNRRAENDCLYLYLGDINDFILYGTWSTFLRSEI
jgi:hypothetical protein